MPKRCPYCNGAGWLCEAHDVPYTEPHREVCAGPGDACPRCNPDGEVDWLAVDTEVENGPLQAGDVAESGTVPRSCIDHGLLQRRPVRDLLIP